MTTGLFLAKKSILFIEENKLAISCVKSKLFLTQNFIVQNYYV